MESVPHSFDGADFFGNCPYSSALSQEFAFLENFNAEEEYPKKSYSISLESKIVGNLRVSIFRILNYLNYVDIFEFSGITKIELM